MPALLPKLDPDDPLRGPGPQDLHWSRDNVGEAAPGVQTPLSWTLWGPIGDRMAREAAYRLGALTRAERTPTSDADRVVQCFYGRVAIKVEYASVIGDRMPGTSGQDAVMGLIGRVPEDMEFRPTTARYAAIAWRVPLAFLTTPRRLSGLARDTDVWWRGQIPRLPQLDRARSIALFQDAAARFDVGLTLHSVGLLGVVQPLYEAVSKLVEQTGAGGIAALSGSGGAEMAIIEDIWKASRAQIDIRRVVENHGFHGPLEGELSSRVWREDPAPLGRIVAEYASRDDSEDPRRRAEGARRRLPELQREVLAALPRTQRPAARLVLALAASRIPLRGVGKRSYLQAFDVARGAARRAGECLAAEDRLDDPDDVFYLTVRELTGPLPAHTKALVARRREQRVLYEGFTLAGSWKGTPTPMLLAADDDTTLLTGIGASAGVVEGVVRVVTDPGFAEVAPNEILVAPTTDPSWASILFVSAALVVDIGGPLAHAAVVARELGIPCVVGTRSGTQRLRTGDHVRVDGGTGTVEILERGTRGGVDDRSANGHQDSN